MIAMSIIAQLFAFMVGVDTHARNHFYAVICASTGRLLDTRDFPYYHCRDQARHDWGRPAHRR